jgi:hypothetical protein
VQPNRPTLSELFIWAVTVAFAAVGSLGFLLGGWWEFRVGATTISLIAFAIGVYGGIATASVLKIFRMRLDAYRKGKSDS